METAEAVIVALSIAFSLLYPMFALGWHGRKSRVRWVRRTGVGLPKRRAVA